MPKSSIEMRTPSARIWCSRSMHRAVVLQQHRLGDFELEPARPAGRRRPSAETIDSGSDGLRNCTADRLTATVMLVRPGDRVAAGLPAAPSRRAADQADFLGDRNEDRPGEIEAALRMVPAHQRLEAADLALARPR